MNNVNVSGITLTTLAACTADDGGTLTYTTSDTHFTIDSTTQVITTTSTALDYEGAQKHTFEVEVKDSGPTTGTTTVTVVVDVSLNVFIDVFGTTNRSPKPIITLYVNQFTLSMSRCWM